MPELRLSGQAMLAVLLLFYGIVPKYIFVRVGKTFFVTIISTKQSENNRLIGSLTDWRVLWVH